MNPFEQQVRERAYYIWEDEGRVFGQAEAHWLRAEIELLTPSRMGIEVIQAATADVTLSASPAAVLAETLKGKPSRSRSAGAKVETKAKAAADTKATNPVAAKAPAAKTATAKTATAKTATAKTVAAKTAAAKTAAAKTPAAEKAAVAKAAVTKAAVTKTPRAPARGRVVESVATVH
ncbi:DUF2934 domain-containing protein [Methylobacterium sp. Leaf89]|uniref:DUF2934 domain-containing protein n=1 Tax=Methylobacterium sp. Leaf89 TaxID=1736245 RepID=UPI0006FC2498|nr:DUF2934 domain-containing protein [Methylobacterium sp. Leaf89]KQO67215.1 hypothetical protein ASF18_11105 [Methylobacterium sp. Leaf89]